MKFLGLGVPELIIILVVILLIFGPKNLPKLGRALGSTVKNLREGMGLGKKDEIFEEAEVIDSEDSESEDSVKAESETRKVRVVKKTAANTDEK